MRGTQRRPITPRQGKRLRAALLPLSAAAAGLLPAPCQADSIFTDGALSWGGGLFFGYQLSDVPQRAGFEWGLEAFATHRYGGFDECSSRVRSGFGPSVQLGIKGFGDARLTLAVHGGSEIYRSELALIGELGVSYRFGEDPGASIHIGIVDEMSIINVAFRYQLFREEAWVGGGLRMLPTFGEGGLCIAGRPLRPHDRARIGAETIVSAAHSGGTLAALGFAADAQMECVSISAFVQLALELSAIGAPSALIHRALAAGEDELLHAVSCAALAQRLAPVAVSCTLPRARPRLGLQRAQLLALLARESFEDGCIGEGAAALQLAAAADQTRDPRAAATLHAIARDEAGHAQLAWDVLRYCVAAGGDHVRSALREHAERARATSADHDGPDDLARYGRLAPRVQAQLFSRELERASQRLTRVLDACKARRAGGDRGQPRSFCACAAVPG